MKKILMLIAMVAMFGINAFAEQFTATCDFDNNSSAYVTAEVTDQHCYSDCYSTRSVNVYSYGEKEGSVIVVVKAEKTDGTIITIERLVTIKNGKGSTSLGQEQILPIEVKVYNAICKPVKY